MKLASFVLLFGASAIGLAFACAATACGGKADDAPPACVHAAPPPIVTDARVLRLDVVDFGDGVEIVKTGTGSTRTLRARRYGYDLDGLCSDSHKPESLGCLRAADASAGVLTDGDGGIDNSFGRNLVDYLWTAYAKPSEVMSGFSYLETHSDGRGTLYLGTSKGITFVIPLVDVRLTPSTDGALGTLAAIAPRDAFVASVRSHFNLLLGDEYCKGDTIDNVAQGISASADILVSGAPNPQLECDGISMALQLSGTTVAAVPSFGAGCPPN